MGVDGVGGNKAVFVNDERRARYGPGLPPDFGLPLACMWFTRSRLPDQACSLTYANGGPDGEQAE
ncbi:MAG: hypothetical protein V3U04_01025, partial [Candidatus Aerophobetes bacterium]